MSEVFHDVGGVFHDAGTEARVSGPAPEHSSYGSWVSFDDPDGNGWVLREVTTRLPGRVTARTIYDSSGDLGVRDSRLSRRASPGRQRRPPHRGGQL